jgi:hypothetical protein
VPLGDTDITYDDANRLVTQSGPEDLEFNYDPVGNVTSVTNANGTTTYDYTEINMLSGLRDPQGAETVYTYDALEGTWRDEADHPNGVASRPRAGEAPDSCSMSCWPCTPSSSSRPWRGRSAPSSSNDVPTAPAARRRGQTPHRAERGGAKASVSDARQRHR